MRDDHARGHEHGPPAAYAPPSGSNGASISMMRAPSPFTIASMTWSLRMRRPFGMICVGRWRLPRCQAMRTRCSGSAPRISSKRLGGRDHLDQPSVLQHQRIAAAQRDGVFQIEQEFQPARTRHRHPPPVPVVEIEHDGIGRGVRPAMLAQDLCRADHVRHCLEQVRGLHPSRRRFAPPQDEVLDPHGEERGNAARLEP